MTEVFVDTQFWVARFHPGDQWHDHARAVEAEVEARSLVTSEAVLVEFLNFFSEFRPAVRREAAHVANKIYEGGSVEVVASSDRLFQRGLQLYERRPDKTYSMVDCMPMAIMRERNLTEVCTNDEHFAQEGFTILLGDDTNRE